MEMNEKKGKERKGKERKGNGRWEMGDERESYRSKK